MIDLTGQRFGMLVVVEEAPRRQYADGTKRMYRCRCDCGRETVVQMNNLRAGNSKSCGKCVAAENRHAAMRRRVRPDGHVNRDQAFAAVRHGARRRNLVFELSLEDFLDLSQKECVYCGAPPSNVYELKRARTGEPRAGRAFIYNGVDRVDNTQGYVNGNCAPCCKRCNRAKNDMSLDEFKQWISAVNDRINNG